MMNLPRMKTSQYGNHNSILKVLVKQLKMLCAGFHYLSKIVMACAMMVPVQWLVAKPRYSNKVT